MRFLHVAGKSVDDDAERVRLFFCFGEFELCVEAEVVSDGKTEIYTTGEDGFAACTMENPGEVTVRVKSAPEGYSFKDTETKLDSKSAIVKLDVTKN